MKGVAPALIGHLNCNEQLVKPALTVSGHAAQDGLTAGRVPTLGMYTWLAKSLDTGYMMVEIIVRGHRG